MAKAKDKSILAAAAELRRRAEERLHAKRAELQPPKTEEEAQKLVHELEVHQIELEMQIAELRQARDEMEKLLEQYTDLYDFAPVGYFTLDFDGAIRAANLTGAGLLEIERSRLIGRQFETFIAAADQPVFATFLGNVFMIQDKQACEVALRKEGDSQHFAQIDAVISDSGQECRIVLIDITERKRADEAQAQLATLVDSSDDAIIAKNLDGIILSWNKGAERLFGYRADEIIGKSVNLLLPPELQEEGELILRRLSTGERIEHFETVRLTKDGRQIEVSVTVSPIADGFPEPHGAERRAAVRAVDTPAWVQSQLATA